MTPEVAIALAELILRAGTEVAAVVGRILADTGLSAEEKSKKLAEALVMLRAKDAATQAT